MDKDEVDKATKEEKTNEKDAQTVVEATTHIGSNVRDVFLLALSCAVMFGLYYLISMPAAVR
jgi:predicted secreted protein